MLLEVCRTASAWRTKWGRILTTDLVQDPHPLGIPNHPLSSSGGQSPRFSDELDFVLGPEMFASRRGRLERRDSGRGKFCEQSRGVLGGESPAEPKGTLRGVHRFRPVWGAH